MKKKFSQGFTLTELMVVILLIAILAAIALPMYSNMTLKARFTEYITNARKLGMAQERYFAEQRTEPTTFRRLDINLPNSNTCTGSSSSAVKDCLDNGKMRFELAEYFVAVLDSDTLNFGSFIYTPRASGEFTGRVTCSYKPSAPKADKYKRICDGLGETDGKYTGSWVHYYLKR
ncbi:prepilin-type N-terminal cleavage/methylation domain-containing protein [Parelusimicrobium proximum]|uniref:prepilin-type N-terminal cleavage/methylation domain-containing protein n=1 Tax=Parelusimicrobium proximum TaxID=3228953 RepID=UPI003D16C741